MITRFAIEERVREWGLREDGVTGRTWQVTSYVQTLAVLENFGGHAGVRREG